MTSSWFLIRSRIDSVPDVEWVNGVDLTVSRVDQLSERDAGRPLHYR